MRRVLLIGLLALFLGASTVVLGDTLTFIGQTNDCGVIDTSWSNAGNWFIADGTGGLTPAFRLPLEADTVIINGTLEVDNLVRIQGIIANTNAVINNGHFGLQNLQMLRGSSFNGTVLYLSAYMTVDGPGCLFSGVTLHILPPALVTISAVAPAAAGGLELDDGTSVVNQGNIFLADGTQLTSGGVSQSQLVLDSGSVLSSSGTALVQGGQGGQLVLDNNGIVRAQSGTLQFRGGIEWECSGGSEQFIAVSPASMILFESPFDLDALATSVFSGPGTNRLAAGGTIDGVLCAGGATDPVTGSSLGGNIDILDSLSGAGSLTVVGGTGQGGFVNWVHGMLSLPSVSVQTGASLAINGGEALSGCALVNAGLCTLLGQGLLLDQGSVISNLATGTFEAQADGSLSVAPGGGGSLFDNAGTFRKSGNGTTRFGTSDPPAGLDLMNSGLVEVSGGQLNLFGGSSSGEFRTASGTVLWFWGGTNTLNPGAVFTGQGLVRVMEGAAASIWVIEGDVALAELDVGSNGTLQSPANGTNTIQIQSLVADSNAAISNGNFVLATVQMADSARFNGSTLNVTNFMAVSGSNCLAGATLTVQSGARMWISPATNSVPAILVLEAGSQAAFCDGARLTGGGPPQSKLAVQPGAVLRSAGAVAAAGSALGHLLIDNSGTVCAESGTLQLADTIDWQCASGRAQFKTLDPAALMVFGGPYSVQAGALSRFSGPGTNRFAAGAVVNGTLQVGGPEPVSRAPTPGNVEFGNSISGSGVLHALAFPPVGSSLSWNGGTLSLAKVEIDAGAQLVVNGGQGLSGCLLNNSGTLTWRAPGSFAGGGGVVINNLAGGTFDLQTDVTLGSSNSTPRLAINNAGRFFKSAGDGTTLLAADFINSSGVELQAGILCVQGAWRQTAGSTAVTIGGKQLGAQYSQLAVGGAANLDGQLQLRLINGFTPQPGDTFCVLTCASRSGVFSGLTGSHPDKAFWVPRYGITNLVLTLAAQVALPQPSAAGGKLALPFKTTLGFTYTVQKTDTLQPPNWQTLSTIAGTGAIETAQDWATQSRAFYRVLVQQ